MYSSTINYAQLFSIMWNKDRAIQGYRSSSEELLQKSTEEPFRVQVAFMIPFFWLTFNSPSLQYKPFDDRKRCKHFGHTDCRNRECEKSYVRQHINFSFSLLLLKHATNSPEPEYSLNVLNTGSSDLWIHSSHFSLSTCKPFLFLIASLTTHL